MAADDEGAVEADVVTRSVNVPDAEEDERAEDPRLKEKAERRSRPQVTSSTNT